MKKVWLNTLTPEEVIKRLKNGEIVKNEGTSSLYYMIDNVIIRKQKDSCSIGYTFTIDIADDYFFEEEEPFEITETGVYRTRDGKKAFVYDIDWSLTFPIRGVIEDEVYSWKKDGSYAKNEESPLDIVAKWED